MTVDTQSYRESLRWRRKEKSILHTLIMERRIRRGECSCSCSCRVRVALKGKIDYKKEPGSLGGGVNLHLQTYYYVAISICTSTPNTRPKPTSSLTMIDCDLPENETKGSKRKGKVTQFIVFSGVPAPQGKMIINANGSKGQQHHR